MDPADNPLMGMLAEASEAWKRRAEEHEELRASPEYIQASMAIQRTVRGLFQTLRYCELAVTRWPEYGERFLFPRHQADVAEAVVVAQLAVENGGLNAARRELRYALEVAVNTAYVDEQAASEDLEGKVRFYRGSHVKKQNVDHVQHLPLRLLGSERVSFVNATRAAWVDASNYVHLTKRGMDEKIRLRAEGVRLGLETVEMMSDVAREFHRVCSIFVVLAFESIGPSFTGDILVGGLDENEEWPFHECPFIAAVDAYFDYKHERQDRLMEHRARRTGRTRLAKG
ncbi:hypothetical protein [Novilysobacter luteus]|uniref:HEPN AbiU2-like domain-containing protein n=1 Tax=Novilysobacter luteus TaxID=2822368 RepID=A0ABM8UCB7_9GAMM|nr:hypothetical protein [Lysobacter luteus]CAG4968435.1 hypothetical protein LYB30171_00270 [Lysobacter luteus]